MRQRIRAGLSVEEGRNLRPPRKLSLSEWSEQHAVLLASSAEPGRFRAWGYQPGIADAITDPSVETITVMKAARVGYTVLLDNTIGYFLEHDPTSILMVQPRVEDARDYSKTQIEPMLAEVEALSAIPGEAKAKKANQTILNKVMRNGASLRLVGANSPSGFRRISARVILFDEVDGFPAGGAGKEGDQITLGIKRSESFWNRKIVLGSTPTIRGLSRIEKSWKESDQRRYHVPCPQCGGMQVLEWGGRDLPYGVKWQKDEDGTHRPETAYYVCRHNGCIIEEHHKASMVSDGEWRAAKPFQGHAGFHIWAGYSQHPNATWGKLAAEWLEVRADPLRRQTFINLVLGEPYEDRDDRGLDERRLVLQAEVYPAAVPDRVAVLTAGVDVQDDRLEVEVVGWGRNEESWSIAHEVLEGDPATPAVWQRLDHFLRGIWYRSDGRAYEVLAACVDSGYHTQQVYEFAKERLARRIWAIKGESASGGVRNPVWPSKRPSARNKQAFRPVVVGVNAAKDVIRSRLHLKPPIPGEDSPGFMHFPVDRDINYFAQLVAERSVTKTVGTKKFRVWELIPGRANEALDLRVYAYAALCGLIHFGMKLNKRAEEAMAPYQPPAATPEKASGLVTPAAVPAVAGPRILSNETTGPARRSRASQLAS